MRAQLIAPLGKMSHLDHHKWEAYMRANMHALKRPERSACVLER